MKVLHPNLASRPYRDYRPVWGVAAVLAVLSLALLAYNVQTAYRYFATTDQTRQEIARLEQQIENERLRTRTARQQIAQFDTGLLRARSGFINAQIAQRAFSWSQLLDDLEGVFPNDVRLTRLNPQPRPDGRYTITIDCLAKTEDGLIDLLNNMLASPKFAQPFPNQQAVNEAGVHRFSITAEYIPTPREIRE